MTQSQDYLEAFRLICETRFARAGRDRQQAMRIWNRYYEGQKLSQDEAEIVADCYREALRKTGALFA